MRSKDVHIMQKMLPIMLLGRAMIFHVSCSILCSFHADLCYAIIAIIGRAKRAPHWGVQSRFHVIYMYMSVCMSVVCQIN